YWFFKRPADFEANQSWYYFRMVEPDFTPLPVYDAMKDYITTQEPVLYPGVHQAEHWMFKLPDDAEIVEVDGAEFGQAVRTRSIGYTIASHYELSVRWRSEAPLPDDANMMFTTLGEDGWHITRMSAPEFFPAGHTVPTQLGGDESPP